MSSLNDIIKDGSKRNQVIADCVNALEGEIEKKSGITGMAVKQGYKAVSGREEGKLIPNAIDKLLDGFIEKLEPYYVAYMQEDAAGRPSFSEYLKSREDSVTESLLEVTDEKANNTDKAMLVTAYNTLRPMAANQVKQGLPVVGEIVEKHAVQG